MYLFAEVIVCDPSYWASARGFARRREGRTLERQTLMLAGRKHGRILQLGYSIESPMAEIFEKAGCDESNRRTTRPLTTSHRCCPANSADPKRPVLGEPGPSVYARGIAPTAANSA